jgi:hypothetical protein
MRAVSRHSWDREPSAGFDAEPTFMIAPADRWVDQEAVIRAGFPPR